MPEREFFIDNLLIRIHFIIVMIRWTGLDFPGSLTSTFLVPAAHEVVDDAGRETTEERVGGLRYWSESTLSS